DECGQGHPARRVQHGRCRDRAVPDLDPAQPAGCAGALGDRAVPGRPARRPGETRQPPAPASAAKLMPLASGRGHDGAIPLYADGALFAGKLKAGESIKQKLAGKPAYLVAAKGKIEVSGKDGAPVTAKARDGVAVVDLDEIELKAVEDAEIVL